MKRIKEKFGTIMTCVALISVIGFFTYTNMTYKEFKRIYEEKIDNIELAAKIYAEENLNFFENKVYRITTRKLVNAGYKPNEVECTITKNCGDYEELMDKEIIIEETEEGKIEVHLDTEKPIVTLTYEYNGKVLLASNEEIESISGWTRVDGMHYEKEYVEATDETIIVRDKSKNETEVKIEKAKFKIDRESPVCWNNGKEVEEGKSKELIYGCRDNLSGCKEEEKGRISSTQGEVVIPRYVIEDKAGNKTVCEEVKIQAHVHNFIPYGLNGWKSVCSCGEATYKIPWLSVNGDKLWVNGQKTWNNTLANAWTILPKPIQEPAKEGYDYNATHKGVDYKASLGSEIYAGADGIVLYRYDDPSSSSSKIALLHANGLMTLYIHIAPNQKLNHGDFVQRGSVVGWIKIQTGENRLREFHYALQNKETFNWILKHYLEYKEETFDGKARFALTSLDDMTLNPKSYFFPR